ncbi:hypothetical protein [Planomonospora algeriensis]
MKRLYRALVAACALVVALGALRPAEAALADYPGPAGSPATSSSTTRRW